MGLTFKQPQPVSIQELLEDWPQELKTNNKKSAVEVTFSDDPIALSWASYHVWQNFPQRRWVDLKDVQAHEHDRVIAEQTRRYYRDKIMMRTLQGQRVSEFQTALYGLVTGEAPIMSDQIGMLMKLPYFYTEDMELATVFDQTQGLKQHSIVAEARRDTITPLKRIFCSRKHAEVYQYWFTNTAGEATVLIVNNQNPIRSIVDSLFRQGQPMEVQAHWHYKRHFPSERISWNLGNVELLS